MIEERDLEYLAFSILHGTFNIESPGGCSCDLCEKIRNKITDIGHKEATDFYNEHYPPTGGFL